MLYNQLGDRLVKHLFECTMDQGRQQRSDEADVVTHAMLQVDVDDDLLLLSI